MLKIKLLLIFIGLFLLGGCQTTGGSLMGNNLDQESSTKPKLDPTSLCQLENAMNKEGESNKPAGNACGQSDSSIRRKALEDTALGLAAQGSLAATSKAINCRLERDRWYLETVYNFNGMMLTHGVLPPVLEEGDFTLNLADPNTIRVSDKTYKIIQQARFATTPPNWREYLWMAYNKPEVPHQLLLPRNEAESKIWKCAVRKGWKLGESQATSIFQQNLARLKRDYKGMILYRRLLLEKKISQPFVSRTELGVTGDGNDMRVNDQVLRITVLPQLQTDSARWRPIVVKENDNC